MFDKIKKIAVAITNSIWGFLVISSLFGTYLTYVMFNNCYDQTKEELIEKISKETDSQFRDWVNNYLQERHTQGPKVTVCVSDNNLILGTRMEIEHSVCIFVKGNNESPSSIWNKMQQAQHVPIIVIRPQNQAIILEHLSDTHECSTDCITKQHALKALIDHEYAHIRNKDLTTLLAIKTIGHNLFVFFSLLIALFVLCWGYHMLYIASPYVTILAFMFMSNTHLRYLEQQCDQAICNDVPTLNGFVAFLNELNQLQQKEIDQNQSWLGQLVIRAEHKDGFWASPLFGTHPPVNTRIAQTRKRIKALEALA